jgi:hypothetical protein
MPRTIPYITFFRSVIGFISTELRKLPNAILTKLTSSIIFRNDCINNSAPRTHPNDKLRHIPKSGMSRDHTRTGSRRSRCLGGVAEVRPCETGCHKCCVKPTINRHALICCIMASYLGDKIIKPNNICHYPVIDFIPFVVNQ